MFSTSSALDACLLQLRDTWNERGIMTQRLSPVHDYGSQRDTSRPEGLGWVMWPGDKSCDLDMVPRLKRQHFYVCVYVWGLKGRKGIKRDGNGRQQSPPAFRDELSTVWREKKTSKLKSSLSKNVQYESSVLEEIAFILFISPNKLPYVYFF